MSISRVFEISKRSLLTQQYAIDVTSRNIANVNTEGYKRRRIDLSNLGLGFNGLQGGNLGSNGIIRIRQRFAEKQLWYENQNLGKHQTDEMMMTRLEDIFGEPRDSGLANILNEFWNGWNDLANDPESQSVRALVKDKSVLLANTFNRLHTDLINFQTQIGADIQEKVTQINQKINQIKILNQQMGANNTLDLMDHKDVLVNDLSSLINIDIREDNNGIVTISSGGLILVSGDSTNELTVDIAMEQSILRADIHLGSNSQVLNTRSGEIGSLMDIHNVQIPEQINKINQLARTIAEQVNNIHKNGYSIDGATGINFFKPGISGAEDIEVSEEILNNSSLIATSSTIDESGNGSIAQSISEIKFNRLIEGNTISDNYYNAISHIGNKVKEAVFMRETQESVIQSLQNQRDSVSGVSLDEEMTKLIEYEHAYQAAARMITTADEMVQTILNLI